MSASVVRWRLPLLLVAALLIASWSLLASLHSVPATTSDDWPKYQHDYGDTGYNSGETSITAQTAPQLRLDWSHVGSTGVSAEPIAIGNDLFWGDWGGNVHDTTISGTNAGKDVWMTSLGMNHGLCAPKSAALGGTPTYGAINGTPAVYVTNIANPAGAQNASQYMFALNATTGAVIWKTVVDSDPHSFPYSSTVLYNGSLYTTNTSLGDCPLVHGRVLRLDATTGAIQNVFDTQPLTCLGAGVTGSPAIDAATGMFYVGVGAPGCHNVDGAGAGATDYNTSVLELSASNLALVHYWRLPAGDETPDGDFIDTPTLWDVSSGGTTRHMIGIGNKSGYYYALDRTTMTLVWKTKIATSNGGPQSGQGTISPAVYDGSAVYVASGHQTLPNGTVCPGTVQSLNPATGAVNWFYCVNQGHILGALAGAPGIVVAGAGTHILVFNSSSGNVLYDFNNGGGTSVYPGTNVFWSGAAIAQGHIFQGSMNGTMYALTVPGGAPPSPCPGASSAPTNLVGTTPATGQVSITWTPPTVCGPTPYYAVYIYSAATATGSMSETSTNTFSAPGLQSGTYYIATVTAFNGKGWSAWSAWSPWVKAT